jgi:hypothetical protein
MGLYLQAMASRCVASAYYSIDLARLAIHSVQLHTQRGGEAMRQISSSLWSMTVVLGIACGPIAGPGSGGASSMGGATSVGGAGGSSGTVKCGTTVCQDGDYCCNASCSRCAPRGVLCTMVACTGSGGASGTGCTSDSDCRLYDDYCMGCNCRAVPASIAVDPACGPQDMVQCLVEPCLNQRAVCSNGQCTVAGG